MVNEQLSKLAIESYRQAMDAAKDGYIANVRYILGDAIEFASKAGDEELVEILQAEDCALEPQAQADARVQMDAIYAKIKELQGLGLDVKINELYALVKETGLVIASIAHMQMHSELAQQARDIIEGIAHINTGYKNINNTTRISPKSNSTSRSSIEEP